MSRNLPLWFEGTCRTIEIQKGVFLGLGDDGEPVGSDIQHASDKAQFIALLILQQEEAADAECLCARRATTTLDI